VFNFKHTFGGEVVLRVVADKSLVDLVNRYFDSKTGMTVEEQKVYNERLSRMEEALNKVSKEK